MKVLSRIIAVITLAWAGSANAALMNFNMQYEFGSGDVLTAMIFGDLQSDGDTVAIQSVTMAALNGVLGPATPDLYSFVSASAITSISGLNQDFCVVSGTTGCVGEGFFFLAPPGLNGVQTSPAYGSLLENYSADRWSLTPKTVPLPSTLALFGVGLLIIRRRLTA